MADERYRWLDRETAERLLSGEPLEAVDAAVRDQAEQLAGTLGALSPAAPSACEELPGEAAALAAFRKAHAERAAGTAPVGGHAADAGAVRLGRRGAGGRRRWGRPARFGLAAALAAGMLGGVAVAAGTGALPLPFPLNEPEPATSVSAEETAGPLVTPSPDGSSHGDGRTGSPDGRGEDDDPASGDAAEQARRIAAACRDVRDGEDIGAERRRALEKAAGGAAKVGTYCEKVLSGPDGDGTEHEDGDADGGKGASDEGQNAPGPGSGPGGGSAASGGKGAGQGGDQDQNQDQDEPGGSGEPGDSHDQEDASGGQDAGTAGRGTAGRGTSGRDGGGTDDSEAARSPQFAPTPTTSAQPPEGGTGTGDTSDGGTEA